MTPYEIIDRKKRGHEHTPEEIEFLVRGVTDDSIPDYQLSAWLMAVWQRGMSTEETVLLTEAMRDSGDCLDLSRLSGLTADKHSTGGVGDKISLLLAPLAAELGLFVPMLSGRGLGHTGGTLDKLQAIPGYRVDLSPDEMLDVVERVGCSIIGQTARIAPADRKLYALRDVTATVDCIPLIVSSILSKKFAAGPEHLVIDLKCGSGAFMRDLESARKLAEALLSTGRRAGKKISALITDMGQPLGQAIGHALEVREAVEGLQGGGPSDQRACTVELVAEMGRIAGLGDRDEMRSTVLRKLDDGSALERFRRMVEAQGGRLDADDPLRSLDIAPEVEPFVAERDGHVGAMDVAEIGLSVVDLGGGRRRHDDRIDLSVGLRWMRKRGEAVKKGDLIAHVHARDAQRAEDARRRLARAVRIEDEAPPKLPLVLERVEAR